VPPRIRLIRSFDERSHAYLGYALRLEGVAGGQAREFSVGIGAGAQDKHAFRVGDVVSGLAVPVAEPEREPVEFYRASAFQVARRDTPASSYGPPWTGVAPPLPTYRERGHRRLDARTYESKCRACIWGCRMPVDIILDKWRPEIRKHRFETFCYGPKSCPFHRAGPMRKVPGRSGVTWEEEDWIDEEVTSHRARMIELLT